MRTNLISIGSSQGIRIPNALIEQLGLTKKLEMAIERGALVIRPRKAVRAGWASAAIACRKSVEDRLHEWDAITNEGAGDGR